MKAVYALSVLAAAASALTFQTDPFWKAFKATYGKVYAHDREEARRYEVFNKNMQEAAELNAAGDDAEYGMTPVSDLFPEEIMMNIETPDVTDVVRAPEPTAEEVAALPASFDARKKGWVPAIRNQGQCGSCWAFAVTSVMSINYAKKKGKTPPVLSEQQLVDCDKKSYGCSGGWPIQAATYAKTGVMLNSDYKYTARAGTCKYKAAKVKAKVSTTGELATTVNAMKTAINKNGAIVVILNANKMQSYKSGIMNANNCPAKTSHAVTAIGWGKSGSTPYWIIRNSWDTWWGEKGYFRIVMGKNACGVESWPEYITVV